VVSPSTVTIAKFYAKLFVVVSTTISSLNKQMYKVFSIISATISTLIPAVFPRLGAVIRYTFTVDFRDRLIDVYKERIARRMAGVPTKKSSGKYL
jgi:hypothetical protein